MGTRVHGEMKYETNQKRETLFPIVPTRAAMNTEAVIRPLMFLKNKSWRTLLLAQISISDPKNIGMPLQILFQNNHLFEVASHQLLPRLNN